MELPEVLMGVAAGIGIQAAFTHGLVGLSRRPRDRVRIAFAVAAAAVAVGALAVLAMYSASTAPAYVAIMKWVSLPAGVVWMVATVWLVAFFAGVQPTRWLLALTAGFCAAVAINFALPGGLMQNGTGKLVSVRAAGTEVMALSGSSPHVLHYLVHALTLAGFVFLYYAAYRVYRRGDRARAGYLGLMIVLLSFTTFIDNVHGYAILGTFTTLYLTQVCFAGLIVATSIALRQEAVRVEAELRMYRARLESLVDARVADLDSANEQLAVEVRERLAIEASLRRRVAVLDSLQRITQTLAEREELGPAIDEASRAITELFTARYARVFLLSEEAAPAADETAMHADAPGPSPRAEAAGALGAAFLDRAVVEQAIWQHGSVALDAPDWPDLPADLRARIAAEGIAHLLVVALVARSEMVGVLSIARDEDGAAFSVADRQLAKMVADALAAVIEIDLLHRKETKEAAEEERQRLARDLHDAVTQNVYGASLIAEALPTVWKREPDEGLRNLETLRRLVRGALAEMRTLLFELRPATLDAAPLDTLLQRLGDSLGGQAQIPVDIHVAEDVSLPRDVKLVFYRVAQEAFSNIGKHARATRVTAVVGAQGGGAMLTVRDDGNGFDPGAVTGDHMGLRIMRERLDRVEASLAVDSAPGRGTTVTVVWPRPGPDGLRQETGET